MDSIIYNIAVGAPGFLLAIVCHEMAHAYVAMRFGDDTAKRMGRVSFNPLVHLDPIGTVLFPLIGALGGWTMFGWAKPVPVDMRNFKKYRQGIFWVSFAGPGVNILLGVLSAFLMAFMATQISPSFYLFKPFMEMLKSSVMINFVLAVFNLIPFPPLDGSRMVAAFLDYDMQRKYESLQRFSFVFILILWFTPIFKYLLYPALAFANHLIFFFIKVFS